MISVCMAVKNGERFLGEQLNSILPQLGADDQIIISDDSSTDKTNEVVHSYFDSRIRLTENPATGLVNNFEHALQQSRGEIIFLADQDDVWMPNKIKHTMPFFKDYDLVVSDCVIVDDQLNFIQKSFFDINDSGKGIVRNLFRNSYMGCCMAFKKSILKKALPFPSDLAMHDQWLGLVAELHGRVVFHPEKLILHRRHTQNASSTTSGSNQKLSRKISNRVSLIKNLIYAR
jgi:glycosyltransferase involved in cell wall biosynthesis